MKRLVLIVGQEGVGKSTLVRQLVWKIDASAAIDGEDLALVNPWDWDDRFKRFLAENVLTLAANSFAYGCQTVFAASFFDTYADFQDLRDLIPPEWDLVLVQLCAPKAVRDLRRQSRPKAYSQEASDWVDENFPEDQEFVCHQADYRYLRIDNEAETLDATVEHLLGRLAITA